MVQFYGIEHQDCLPYYLLGHQKEGFFLDVGCQLPTGSNNTYLLETLGWNGLAFDRTDSTSWSGNTQWYENRHTPRFILDATSRELTDTLLTHAPKNTIVDYISLDIDDDGGLNYGVQGLLRILNAGVVFKTMTFEHEAYRHQQSNGEVVRAVSRIILQSLNYIPLFIDVSLGEDRYFEDWWINPLYFNEDILSLQSSRIPWQECEEKLSQYKNK